jgi:hypothetical protein
LKSTPAGDTAGHEVVKNMRLKNMQGKQRTVRDIRVAAGISLVALFAALSILSEVRLFYKLHDSYWSLLDIQDYDRRYEAAQDFLPPFGVFGYLDDLRDPVESDVEYVLAGYNLAPRLLQQSTRHALIIGNFTRHPCDIEALTEKGLLLVKDFGNGVAVLRRGQQ